MRGSHRYCRAVRWLRRWTHGASWLPMATPMATQSLWPCLAVLVVVAVEGNPSHRAAASLAEERQQRALPRPRCLFLPHQPADQLRLSDNEHTERAQANLSPCLRSRACTSSASPGVPDARSSKELRGRHPSAPGGLRPSPHARTEHDKAQWQLLWCANTMNRFSNWSSC